VQVSYAASGGSQTEVVDGVSCARLGWIKAVTGTVQLNKRPQYVGNGKAEGGGGSGAWRPQPAPSRRAVAMIYAEISSNLALIYKSIDIRGPYHVQNHA
jgi:hypothetical protein